MWFPSIDRQTDIQLTDIATSRLYMPWANSVKNDKRRGGAVAACGKIHKEQSG